MLQSASSVGTSKLLTPPITFCENLPETVTKIKAKLNKWGFIHVLKKALPSLPFRAEEPLTARIDGERLIIVATTENQPEKARPKTEKT